MYYISDYFDPSEFECPCCGINYKISDLLSLTIPLEKIRNDIGLPIIISSGRRCSKHNDELSDSVPNSQHVCGIACDIYAETVSPIILAMLAFRYGFRSIGIGDTYIHVDMRDFGTSGSGSIWYY